MKKSKYYTPKIEEFAYGLEYEMKPSNYGWERGRTFIYPESIHDLIHLHGPSSLESYINKERVRVKYLDKYDIEDLGFKFDKTSVEGQWKFFKDNICLFYRPETKELGTFTIDPTKSDFMSKYARDNKMVSFLMIKNKCELKKLLKQLKILE